MEASYLRRAVRGRRAARMGYQGVFCGGAKWGELLPDYRRILYGKGVTGKGTPDSDRGRIDPTRAERAMFHGGNRGKLPLSDVLRTRVRYFSAGTAIGSEVFLSNVGGQLKDRYGLERKRNDYPMRCADWGGLRSFWNLQVDPVGLSSLN